MELWRDGYDVYCHTFTSFLESIEKQACKLEEYVEQVLQDTGWDRVDLVGGSMGGLVVRYYLNFLGGTDKVEDVVMIASPNHGTWKALLIAPICQSGQDMVPNSPFLRQFRGEDETPGNEDGVLYMSLLAAVDQEINPDWSALLDGARNIRVWNCIGHQPMFFNETVYKLMVSGIEGGGWNNN
jgi:pimeloyl-ACP methyl ester carboxylesterase